MTQPARVTAFSFCLCYRRPNHLNALRFTLGIFSGKIFLYLQTSQPCGVGLFAFSQKKLLLVQRAVAWDRFHSFYKNYRRRGRSAGPEAGRGVSSPPPSGLHPPRNEKGAARPFQTPKLLGSIQKIQVAPLKDFLCSADFESLARRDVRATAYFHADANAPAGSQRQQIPFAVTTFPVKKQIRKIRRSSGAANIKNNFSADDGAAHAEPF